MPKTLLKQVQDVLSAIDSENVNSLDETEEAAQVVNIIQRAYDDILSHHNWKHLRVVESLDTGQNLNELKLDDYVISIDPDNLWYKTARVSYITPERFLELTIKRDTTDANTTMMNGYKIHTNRDPQFYSSVDGKIFIFDSVPDPISGLKSSDSRAFLYRKPSNVISGETEEFNLPEQALPAFTDLCLSLAKAELKGDIQDAERFRRMYKTKMARLGNNKSIVDKDFTYKDFMATRPTQRHFRPNYRI